ncbi:MAG: nucleotide pyrophosphohydrolase [Opitutae bacterium]|nr:nucleotide pyrophosphohydrolase [Opitutae bacterium]
MSEIQRLRDIVFKLRAPDGCPWDREQTHHSLARCLVEEASEVLEAIDGDDSELMEEELGDLLLQVVMHACLAEEVDRFDLEDVARGINEKLIRRHPHVFGDDDQKIDSSSEVVDRWEQIKAEEKKNKPSSDLPPKLFKDLPPRLPALLFAHDVYKRALKADLESDGEWNDDWAKELSEGLDEDSVGRTLFQLVGACRRSGIDPESALRRFASRQVSLLEPEVAQGRTDDPEG